MLMVRSLVLSLFSYRPVTYCMFHFHFIRLNPFLVRNVEFVKSLPIVIHFTAATTMQNTILVLFSSFFFFFWLLLYLKWIWIFQLLAHCIDSRMHSFMKMNEMPMFLGVCAASCELRVTSVVSTNLKQINTPNNPFICRLVQSEPKKLIEHEQNRTHTVYETVRKYNMRYTMMTNIISISHNEYPIFA